MTRRGVLMAVSMMVLTALMYTSAATSRAEENFAGRVYDIDYLGGEGWTQVLVRDARDSSGLVATTSIEYLQHLLEAALITGEEVSVTYWRGQTAEIRSAGLRASPASGCTQKGCVDAVSCSAVTGRCSAKILGESGEVHTDSIRAVSILLTAIVKKKPVEYLSVDTGGSITRVKINLP